MRLIATICSTDHKGRPYHRFRELAESELRTDLVKIMDADVQLWQAEDISIAKEEAEEDGTESREEWEIPNVRWEMSRKPDDPREFVSKESDGGICTVVYHVVD